MLLLPLSLWVAQTPPISVVTFSSAGGGIVTLNLRINGKAEIQALLDSGSVQSYLDEKVGRDTGARAWVLKDEVIATGGKASTIRADNINSVIVGSPIRPKIEALLPLGIEFNGLRLEAVLGADLFARYVIAIDYQAKELRFYDPSTYEPPHGFHEFKVDTRDGRPIATIEVQLPGGKFRKAKALVDTGFGGVLDAKPSFIRRERLVERFKDAPESGKVLGVGGLVSKRSIADVEGRIGKLEWSAYLTFTPPAEDRKEDERDYDLTLGSRLLSYYDVVFDLGRSRMYLRQPLKKPS